MGFHEKHKDALGDVMLFLSSNTLPVAYYKDTIADDISVRYRTVGTRQAFSDELWVDLNRALLVPPNKPLDCRLRLS